MSSSKRTPQVTKELLDDSDDAAEWSDEYTPHGRSGHTNRTQVPVHFLVDEAEGLLPVIKNNTSILQNLNGGPSFCCPTHLVTR
jgi:hypothetical protein